MRNLKILGSMFFLGAFLAAGLPNAKADVGDWDAYMTFSAPVEVPGMVLAPGKYEFKRVESGSREGYIAILNSRGDVMDMLFAEPEYRLNTTDKSVVKLMERVPGSPEALQSWYYPDSHYGVRFLYPKPHGTGQAQG